MDTQEQASRAVAMVIIASFISVLLGPALVLAYWLFGA